MAKTKISEFSATPGNNTDIDGINIAEGCAPSGINDAIRELMSQLKDFQAGTAGDSFNGPVGTTTAAAGAFTTLSASSTVTLSGGTANGVAYLNGSKVLTTGSALVFDGSNLGLGVTPSAWATVPAFSFGTSAKGSLSYVGGATSLGDNFYRPSAGVFNYTTTATAGLYQISGATHAWYTAPSGTAGTAITFTQAMTLDASGNLLVGGTSQIANERLLVRSAGTARFTVASSDSGTPGAAVNLIGSTTSKNWLVGTSYSVGGALEFIPSTTNGGTTFSTPAMLLDSSGNLLVGQSSNSSARISLSYTGGSSLFGIRLNTANTGTSTAIQFVYNASTQTGSITCTTTATTYGSGSDYRLKENVQPMTGALEKVSALNPVTWKWKANGTDGQGFLAHELQTVIPDAVVGEKDAVNEDGSIKPQMVDTSFVVATLTAALQEAHGLIKDLQARVDALEAK